MTISSVLTQSCTHTLLQVHEDCNTGDYYTDTSLLRWCNRESHSRVLRGEGGGKGKEDARKRGTSPCTYKALASVYITYVVQFHDVSLQFRHDGFSTITQPYFSLSLSPRPPHVHFTIFLPLLFLSLLLSFPASGAAHHFVNQDKLEISCREIQPRYWIRLGGIYWATTVYPVVPTRY